MESLRDKIVVVVGGSSGIGLATGAEFARHGARVVLSARTAAALQACTELPEVGHTFATRQCDAADLAQVRALFQWVGEQVGPPDILVYSAGTNIPRRLFSDVTPEDFDHIVAVNAKGAFNCFHTVLPGMRERGRGLILNIVSIAALRPSTLSGMPYCASKSAQGVLGTSANLEALPDGVRVTNIYPGETETPILDRRPVPPSAERRAQMLQPADVAEMAVAIARLPARAVVPEIVITPWYQPFA